MPTGINGLIHAYYNEILYICSQIILPSLSVTIFIYSAFFFSTGTNSKTRWQLNIWNHFVHSNLVWNEYFNRYLHSKFILHLSKSCNGKRPLLAKRLYGKTIPIWVLIYDKLITLALMNGLTRWILYYKWKTLALMNGSPFIIS